MVRRRGFWLACACAPVLTACSLLLGEGFTDPNAPPPSAPPRDADVSNPDASPEGGPITDGSQPDVEAGPDSGGCPVAAVSFCDNFNRSDAGDVRGAWDVLDLNAGGTVGLEAETLPDRIFATAVSAKGGQAQLSKTFVKQPAKIHLEMNLTVSSYGSVGGVYIGGIFMQTGSDPPSLVYLYVDTVRLVFVQQIADGINYVSQALPSTVGVAEHISIDLTFNGKVVVKVDGVPKIDENAQTFLVPKAPSLYLGASSIDGAGDDGAFLIDDLVFTID